MKRWVATSEDCLGEFKDHDYEELSSPRFSEYLTTAENGYLEAVSHKTTSAVVTIPNVIPSSVVRGSKRSQDFRHRDNPLYDSTSSSTLKSRDDCSDHVTSTSSCSRRCLLLLVAIAVVLATAAVVMTTISSGVLFADEGENVSSEMTQTGQHVGWTMIQLLRENFTRSRAEASRVVGNMSACFHGSISANSHIDLAETRTDDLDLTKGGDYYNWVVTGATCSTVNGTEALLDVRESLQYSCVCRGRTPSSTDSRVCVLHYWICPPI